MENGAESVSSRKDYNIIARQTFVLVLTYDILYMSSFVFPSTYLLGRTLNGTAEMVCTYAIFDPCGPLCHSWIPCACDVLSDVSMR